MPTICIEMQTDDQEVATSKNATEEDTISNYFFAGKHIICHDILFIL